MGHNLLQVPLPPPSPSLSDRGVGHDSSAKLLKMEMRISPWCDSRRIGRLIKETIVGGIGNLNIRVINCDAQLGRAWQRTEKPELERYILSSFSGEFHTLGMIKLQFHTGDPTLPLSPGPGEKGAGTEDRKVKKKPCLSHARSPDGSLTTLDGISSLAKEIAAVDATASS